MVRKRLLEWPGWETDITAAEKGKDVHAPEDTRNVSRKKGVLWGPCHSQRRADAQHLDRSLLPSPV